MRPTRWEPLARNEREARTVEALKSEEPSVRRVRARAPDVMKRAAPAVSCKLTVNMSALAEGDAHGSIYRGGLSRSPTDDQLFDNRNGRDTTVVAAARGS